MLARKSHTVGNSTRYWIDYGEWLPPGVPVKTADIVSPSATLTVDRVLIGASGHVYFYVNGGLLDETVDVSVTITNNINEIKEDIVQFHVIAP